MNMTSMHVDLEGAFTSGDPEAVLDLLAIRFLRMRHCNDDVASSGGILTFPNENDLEAFVRDFAIDDAISDCFADLPTSPGGLTLTSDSGYPLQFSVASSPEKKLISSGSTPCQPAITEEQPSPSKGLHSTTVRQPPQGQNLHSVSDSSNTLPSKSRGGFLATLLTRGVKGRKKSLQFPRDEPSGPQCPSANASLDLNPAITVESGADLAASEFSTKNSAVSVPEVKSADEGSRKVYNPGACDQSVFGFLGRVGQNFEKIKFHPPSESNAELVDKPRRKCPCKDISEDCRISPNSEEDKLVISSLRIVPKRLEIAEVSVHSSSSELKFTRSSKTPVTDGRGESSDSERALSGDKNNSPRRSTAGNSHSSGSSFVPPADSSLWEGWRDGIDSFIDFERDPNLELPLDLRRISCNLQAGFEHRSMEDATEHFESTGERPRGKPLVADGSEPVAMTSRQTSKSQQTRTSVTSDNRPSCRINPDGTVQIVQGSYRDDDDDVILERPLISTDVTHQAPTSLLTFTRRTTGTQTEKQQYDLYLQAAQMQRADHCLRNAVSQLSVLSVCSACESIVGSILAELGKSLKDLSVEVQEDSDRMASTTCLEDPNGKKLAVKGSDSVSNANRKYSDVGIRASPRKRESLNKSVLGEAEHSSEHRAAATETEFTNLANHRVNSLEVDPDIHSRHHIHIHSNQIMTLSPQVRTPEQTPKRPPKNQNIKRTAASRSLPPNLSSDSDSSSTVTSEPTTVRTHSEWNHAPLDGRTLAVLSLDSSVCGPDAAGRETRALSFVPSSYAACDLQQIPGGGSSFTRAIECATHKRGDVTNGESRVGSGWRRLSKVRGKRCAEEGIEEASGSIMTSSWSEMTSVSSLGDPVTSADESSYYSGDENEDLGEDDLPTGVRLGLQDEDREDSELRQQRLQRHLAAVLRQATVPDDTMETVVTATGDRLNHKGRHRLIHINQGTVYPFDSAFGLATSPANHRSHFSSSGTGGLMEEPSVRCLGSKTGLTRSSQSTEAHTRKSSLSRLKGGATPRLFSPDRQVALVAARQMTSDEFREGYDRSNDIAKAKGEQLDKDVPWDLLHFSDTDEDAGSEKAWCDLTSEEESVLPGGYSTDTDSSAAFSDW